MRFCHIAAIALVAGLAACTTPPKSTEPVHQTPVGKPGLPGGVVRTDGKQDIQVAWPGKAHCRTTSEAELSRALAATNAARKSKGLAPMVANAKAQQAAEKHACDMASRGVMTHVGKTTKGPSARLKEEGYKPQLAAENIAAGAFSFDRTMREWTASPLHLDNIVIPGVKDFGVGYAVSADGRSTFFAAVYAQPR